MRNFFNKKLRVNVSKSKVMRCLRCGNGGSNACDTKRVDYFKYLGAQVVAHGGCESDVLHKINPGYRAWGVLINGG